MYKSYAYVFAAVIVCCGMYAQASKTGNAVITMIENQKQFGELTMTLGFEEKTGFVELTKESSSATGDQVVLGKYELCFYEYGGYDRTLDLGNLFTYDHCVGDPMDSALVLSDRNVTGATCTKSQDSSLIGRAAALVKRSIAIYIAMENAGDSIGLELVKGDGSVVDTATTVTSTNASELAAVLNFDSSPTGTYTLRQSNYAGTETYVIAENTGSSYFWKSFMLTTLDTSNYPDTQGTAEAYPAIETSYSELVVNDWSFPTAAETSKSIDPSTALTVTAVGAIGLDNQTPQNGGGPSTTKIICEWDDVWGQNTIYGRGLLSKNTDGQSFLVQAMLSGLSCSGSSMCNYSFHFHANGDISGSNGASEISPPSLGAILTAYSLDGFSSSSQEISTYYRNEVSIPTGSSFDDLVGTSLTVHDGPFTENVTVAWGVCGVAPSTACMRYTCPDVEYTTVNTNGVGRLHDTSLSLFVLLSLTPIVRMVME